MSLIAAKMVLQRPASLRTSRRTVCGTEPNASLRPSHTILTSCSDVNPEGCF